VAALKDQVHKIKLVQIAEISDKLFISILILVQSIEVTEFQLIVHQLKSKLIKDQE